MADPLLSSLCSICHVKAHKYRCPRCSTLTCSLPCIKRHKQWAQCNGIRDPAVYMKQKDLATPKGIDHDYNYLTSIERELDYAEKNASSRGVILKEEVRQQGTLNKGEIHLNSALERCGIVVERAPKGMTRSKQNETMVSKKSRSLRWTVEWVHPDGQKALGMCAETQLISEAYVAHLNSLDPERPSKKRKPNQPQNTYAANKPAASSDPPEAPSSKDLLPIVTQSEKDRQINLANDDIYGEIVDSISKPSVSSNAPGTTSQARKERRRFKKSHPIPKSQVDLATQQQLKEWRQVLAKIRKPKRDTMENPTQATEDGEETQATLEAFDDTTPEQREIADSTATIKPSTPDTISNHTQEIPHITLNSDPPPTSPLAFYLHHPSLPSRHPVLIPLSPDSILATSLTNRLVLEFPTIYVLHRQTNDKLPEAFISEEDFFAAARKELIEEVTTEGDSSGRVERVGKGGQGELEEGEVDEKRLLEVLGKDLKEITGLRD